MDGTVTINLQRYEELVKKECLFDSLMEDKGINMYLYQKVEEELKEDDK